jgi:hypothetical protein
VKTEKEATRGDKAVSDNTKVSVHDCFVHRNKLRTRISEIFSQLCLGTVVVILDKSQNF